MKLNLPNKLTVLRMILVPIILVVGMLPSTVIPFELSCIICAFLFIATAVTDMLDGKIARRHGLITDFGKFLDPVADKFLVIGAMFILLYKFENLQLPMIITLIVVVFRELAVTSMRLVVSTGKNVVIAANSLGKIKTVSQIVFVSTVLLEPTVEKLLYMLTGFNFVFNIGDYTVFPITYLTMIFTVVMTLWSGINYIVSYWKFLAPEK